MASAQTSVEVPITIHEFVTQNPLKIEDVLEDFGINSTPIKVAIAHGHEIAFDIAYSSIPIDDHAQIGKNVTVIMKLKNFFDKKGIPFFFDMTKVVFGVNISFSIWLNDKVMPFIASIEDVIARIAPQTHNVASFVALTLAYDEMEISLSNVLERAFEYQAYGLPPVRSSKSVILTRAMNPRASIVQPTSNVQPISSIPNFSWKAISSPSPSPAPIPSLVQIPENAPEYEEKAPVPHAAQANEKQWQTQGRPRRQIFGAGLPPVSMPLDSTYNGKPPGKPQVYVQDFIKFWNKGKEGIEIDGEIVPIPELDRFRRYTSFAIKFTPKLSDKNPNNTDVISFMKEKLGEHFDRWNQYDWNKIDLTQPFPEENPPMKSS